MQINPKLIKKQFEKSLETYNKNATVQKLMGENLISELSKVNVEYKNILELGCGAGLLTELIAKKLKFNRFFANDLVEKSEKYVKSIVPDAVFYYGDASKIKPTAKMDLIISNAMFQWFNNLEKVTTTLKNMLNPQGVLAFTSFTPDNYREIKELTGISLKYKTLDEVIKILGKNYEIIYSKEIQHTMTFSNPLELLAHMKNTGVNSLNNRHWTFKEVKDFCEKYRTKYPDTKLTYAGMIVICKRL